MLYSPSRSLWMPPSVVPLLRGLTPLQWEQGTRPWHQDPAWSPGRAWRRGEWVRGRRGDTARRMHALGIVFPGAAQVRREATQAAVVVGPGAAPFSFWRLDEASGTRADTGATGGNDLTPTGTPGNATGNVGSAVALNGTTQQLHTGATAGMGLGTGVSFSLSLWVFATSLAAGDGAGVASNCNGSCSVGYDLFMNSSGFRAYVGTVSNGRKSVDVAAGSTPNVSTWYNVVMRYDSAGKTLHLRVNDNVEATLATVSDIGTTTTAFILGNEPLDGSFFAGRIDAVGYWGSLLSGADVTALYNLGAGTEYYGGSWH